MARTDTARANGNDHHETGTVECGSCSRPLEITRQQWERWACLPCPCGSAADLEFARRHCEWDDTTR
ncbi:hypothetical protein [Amycolatopsis echigonensis]|uniref:Uncharacterized protein n=1 Tax=Amycolatopsis echigonensis TaxID=2576905 RepID=A0A2N3WF18_9PSEU|nr:MULTISPECIES: hypothetical protein [Amycolatopsis]MBB2505446.1 hypothetical protein [Amycolatopsis echigonensis]PKV92462.1 hypothetical protein ATK30_3266 [Amycolatopsis niigatensis]GHG81098.1 hypothetical protein GCM10017788_50750 [Amycolatopsis acidiphila]